ncbi:hypothetical protein [Micromonospora sp. CB01531]|uniref:hypothetical protein n=1 Tax=Micromonospora sp. CB01531 TaxID=1718947 RepID=UPI000969972E|nr:hypothetical protein [Micromonospora sp. CB01531]OKI56401.1 hypothetical protein A6A27_30510 [Micromonospora sp. CB01531]
MVFLPTYGSWLNWIESEFAALRYFALNGTDHRSHDEQNAALAAYIRWRNSRGSRRLVSRPSHRSGSGPHTWPQRRDEPPDSRSLRCCRSQRDQVASSDVNTGPALRHTRIGHPVEG